ncbi:MAG: hypothetical protein Q8O87_03470 [bacterium]|nr:hypothetical protein [bacterium]
MEMPLSEIIDRYTILKLKMERLSDAQKNAEALLAHEFATYSRALEEFKSGGVSIKSEWLDDLYKINGRCWDLEADIRQGKEGDLGLEEVGRRAIMIRDINQKRVAVKNIIARETGLGFQEVKINHASADTGSYDVDRPNPTLS